MEACLTMKRLLTVLRAWAACEGTNLEAARIIASDPERIPPGSGCREWAELCLQQLDPQRKAAARCLFEENRGFL